LKRKNLTVSEKIKIIQGMENNPTALQVWVPPPSLPSITLQQGSSLEEEGKCGTQAKKEKY
jgi:hypothetical protein